MDFTLNKYENLCHAIKKNYRTYTVRDYLIKKPIEGVILRHDVDRRPENALRMAQLEHELGIKATYYFRYPKTFIREIIDRIYSLGHEIGFHYEVLDKTKGNHAKALELFVKELGFFKKWNIKSIAMHGNPLKRWSNRDLWMKHDFKKYGIIGETYLSFNPKHITYFTDTGRKWNDIRFNKKDHFNKTMIKIENSDELIKQINVKRFKVVYISSHPERWTDNITYWIYNLVWQSLKNVGKRVLR